VQTNRQSENLLENYVEEREAKGLSKQVAIILFSFDAGAILKSFINPLFFFLAVYYLTVQ